jgi:hypothetical protein
VRKVVQISTMVHQEKDWAFIALCDDVFYHVKEGDLFCEAFKALQARHS